MNKHLVNATLRRRPITEVITGRLWMGDISKLEIENQLYRRGVRQIASICDFKPALPSGYPIKRHIFLSAEDGTELEPEHIHDFVTEIIDEPTYLHCYSGMNRSTAMACCAAVLWGFRNDQDGLMLGVTADAILTVMVKRNSDLAFARDGSFTQMTWQMMSNVVNYVKWLESEELT